MISVELKQATLLYRQQIIFRDLHLPLVAGHFTCILGPSGVGKSSLLRVLAGLTFDKHAQLDYQLSTSDHLPLQGRVALMSQQDNLLPWCSVVDNVLLGYRLRKQVTPDLRQQAMCLLQQVGLQGADLDKRVTELSGGMRQRVALVRTLLENKPIVLMDEPFSALDSVTRFKLQTLTASLLHQKTVLFITHDPLEALRLADHIYVLQGTPARLTAFKTPSMNPPRDFNADLLQEQAALWSFLADGAGA